MAKDWTQDETIKQLEIEIEQKNAEIERLRKESRLYWDAFQKAANELERLREALRLMPKTITDAADEIERLRYALQWIASCEGGDVYEIWKEMQKTAKAALKEGE